MKILLTAAIIALTTTASFARDNVQVTGSSTVLPYATIVAEAFGENSEFQTPVVEGGGSGAGRKKLCEGVGEGTVDIANSSSKMKDEEWAKCEETVGKITEVRIGYDGIVFASNIDQLNIDDLTVVQLYTALSAHSDAKTWTEVDPTLPNNPILVFIPGTKHGTREVFETKVMLEGCKAVGSYDLFLKENADDKKLAEAACVEVRTDGVSVDIDGDYTETLGRLGQNENALGVFGLSFLMNNTDKLYAADINGVTPSVETISSGDYPVSRPLYFYVKNAHLDLIPGLREYIEFFVSDEIAGPNGPLAAYGLVSDPELAATQKMIADLK